MTSPAPTRTALAASIFLLVAVALWILSANRLVFTNDEGLILDGALRMLHGQKLYQDFFGQLTPGSFWIQAGIFRVLGVSFDATRLMVILDFAVQCGMVFWLAARLAGTRTGFVAAALFFAFQATMPELLAPQHRMDSTTFALLSIAFCLEGQARLRHAWWIAAGLLVALAGICTPSTLLFGPATLLWLTLTPRLRRFAWPYASGLAAGCAALVSVLSTSGLLTGTLRQMRWLQSHYFDVNFMPYGAIIGGYRSALGTGSVLQMGIRAAALFCFVLPAILPAAALAGWAATFRRPAVLNEEIRYLLLCMLVFTLTTFPRMDNMHLAFVAPIAYALTAAWLARCAPRLLSHCVVLFLSVWAMLFLINASGQLHAESVNTPVGLVRVGADASELRSLIRTVHPGDGLYVHPYMPVLYFLTAGRNPTRFSFLNPGMMGAAEELAVLVDLRARPPEWILYLPVSRAEFLRVFPHGGHLDHRFRRIEDWILAAYAPVDPAISVQGYRLYRRLSSNEPRP
uniref:Glycosyltransferase RgtA/B/C/D-like domain-containing protein n=1 Tax=Solibacter usitatus (strain Ellin6076) TaxID=234267 RepID=Q01PL8_SOLUE